MTKHLDKHISRVIAVQFLYSKLVEERENLQTIAFEPNALLNIIEERKYDTKLYSLLVTGALKYRPEIDKIVEKFAPEWPIKDLNPTNLVILWIAIFEAFIARITPYVVVIDQAIEIKKIINPENSAAFINGVLGAIIKDASTMKYLQELYTDND